MIKFKFNVGINYTFWNFLLKTSESNPNTSTCHRCANSPRRRI